ncbi:MAG: hypothetical protein V2I82_00700 [Halieaceae bacterium]|nr:hypothetical protein [Halieaceae bacterium]
MTVSGLLLQDPVLNAWKIDVVAGELLIDIFQATLIIDTLSAPIGQSDSMALVHQLL